MKSNTVYNQFCELKSKNKKAFAVLVDPDKIDIPEAKKIASLCKEAQVDFIFLGGSLLLKSFIDECIIAMKTITNIPVVLFPGSPSQVSKEADALLYLSLISGRNADLLIGQHVLSAAAVKASELEIISTGYIIVDGGAPTTVSYISNSFPIPHDKNDIAICTAMAGEMLGNKIIYMDAGSGANNPISKEMLEKVAKNIEIPLIVGGGIKTIEKVIENCKAGANIIVVGNAIEKDATLIKNLSNTVHQFNQ